MSGWRLATSEDVAAAAELARARGRFGIDTEFMSEGRYRALLCLVQVVVDDDGARRDPHRPDRRARGRSTWRRSASCSPIRRSRSCSTPGVRTWRSCGGPGAPSCSNIFDTQIAAGFAGASAQSGYANLLSSDPRPPGRQERQLHALGRPAADRRTAELRRRGRGPPARAGGSSSSAGCGRPGGSSGRARNAGGSSRRPTSAIPRSAWERLPRDRAARSAFARGGPRARGLARADRRRRGPAGRLGARRSDAGRAGQAPARRPSTRSRHIRGLHPSSIRRRGPAILEAIAPGPGGGADPAGAGPRALRLRPTRR